MLHTETSRAIEEFQVCVQSKNDLHHTAIEFARAHEEYQRATAELIASAASLADGLCRWGQETIESLMKHGTVGVSDSEVRTQITCFSEITPELLRQAESYLSENDLVSARSLMNEARKVAETLYDVQRAWPWVDQQQIDEARLDYETGRLMDLEKFTDGLRGV